MLGSDCHVTSRVCLIHIMRRSAVIGPGGFVASPPLQSVCMCVYKAFLSLTESFVIQNEQTYVSKTSLCFLPQYILSGSDDFNLYMWKIPKDPEAGELRNLSAPAAYLCGCVLMCWL